MNEENASSLGTPFVDMTNNTSMNKTGDMYTMNMMMTFDQYIK